MRSEPFSPLDDPTVMIPERIPGPGNPWLACGGGTGSVGNSKPPLAELDLKEVDPELAGVPGRFDKINQAAAYTVAGAMVFAVGTIMALGGLGMIAAGMSPAGLALGLVLGGLALATIGALIAIGGAVAAMAASIDPIAIEHRVVVELPPARRLALPPQTPPSLSAALGELAAVERLSTAELDLIEYARAASIGKDRKWYRSHMERLYRAQFHKRGHLAAVAAGLRDFVADWPKTSEPLTIPVGLPMRDYVTPLCSLRPQLRELGIGDSELNTVLALSRLPHLFSATVERRLAKAIHDCKGDARRMVEHVADNLANLETIDHALFGTRG